MHIAYNDEQETLRQELRDYFGGLLTPEVQERLAAESHGGETSNRIRRQMGADGWLGVGWPTEYGGQGRSVLEQFVFFDEAARVRAPVPMIALNTVGPTIMRFGTEEQKQAYLPGILSGELDFAIGYTEPNAGTDLASLQTRAVLDGDHFVVNGNKVFTSGADFADYIWLACRTNTEVKKHKGITIMLVDTKSDGFSVSPIHTVGGGSTTATYYEDVRVPVENVIGGVDEGWRMITTQLNHERVALAAMGGRGEELLQSVIAWASDTKTADGQRVIDIPWVQANLARCDARFEACKLMNWRMADAVHKGTLTPGDASSAKVFGSDNEVVTSRLLMEVLGTAGYLQDGSPGAVLAGAVETSWRNSPVRTFGGGSNDVQREIMVQVELGLPRSPR